VIPQGPPRVGQGSVDTADDDIKRHSAGSVRLWIKENFHVHHAVCMGSVQIGRRERMEVALVTKHLRPRVIHIQERLQIGEKVCFAQGLDRRVRESYPVFARELEHHLRLERALDVQMQFSLGNCTDEVLDRAHGRAP